MSAEMHIRVRGGQVPIPLTGQLETIDAATAPLWSRRWRRAFSR